MIQSIINCLLSANNLIPLANSNKLNQTGDLILTRPIIRGNKNHIILHKSKNIKKHIHTR